MSVIDIQSRIAPWLARWSIVDPQQSDAWFEHMSVVSYASDEWLVRAGQHSDTLFLLESGLVRLYYTTPDGKERNKAFYLGGQVTGPLSAALTGSPAPFSIQALELTEVITFRFKDLLQAAKRSEEVGRLYQELLAEAFIRNEQREAMLLTCNAEQRYQWLLEHDAELVERVAQYHIASYLGVDAVSLSRLKRKLSQ